MEEIKQSLNKMQIVGTVEEIDLQFERNKEVELKCGDFKKKSICDVVDFKHSTITVKVERKDEDGNVTEVIIPVNVRTMFNQNSKSLNDKGEEEVNKNFTALETIAKEYTKGTRVQITTRNAFTLNEYPNNNNEWISRLNIGGEFVTSNNVPEEDMADAKITGVIRSIKHEMKNEEETGRIFLDFYMFNYKGETYPVELVVDSDLADDVEDIYEAGSSCQFDVELTSRVVGKTVVKKEKAFGRRDSKIVEGYTKIELNVFRGESPFEEENEYYVDMELMKKAMHEREIMIEQKKKDRKEKSESSNTKQKKGLGTRKATITKNDEEDSPF